MELNRIALASLPLVPAVTSGHDTTVLRGRERAGLERITGLRMNHAYITSGGAQFRIASSGPLIPQLPKVRNVLVSWT